MCARACAHTHTQTKYCWCLPNYSLDKKGFNPDSVKEPDANTIAKQQLPSFKKRWLFLRKLFNILLLNRICFKMNTSIIKVQTTKAGLNSLILISLSLMYSALSLLTILDLSQIYLFSLHLDLSRSTAKLKEPKAPPTMTLTTNIYRICDQEKEQEDIFE